MGVSKGDLESRRAAVSFVAEREVLAAAIVKRTVEQDDSRKCQSRAATDHHVAYVRGEWVWRLGRSLRRRCCDAGQPRDMRRANRGGGRP